MKRLLLPILGLAAFAPISAHALSINIDAETLRNASGGLFPVSGLVILTAATQGSFFGPSAVSFATGSEMVLTRWDLSAWNTPGALSDAIASLSFSGDWNPGDALRLYWYPTLTKNATAPGAGTPYGFYSDAVGIDGSDPWITPAEGNTMHLILSTSGTPILAAQPGSVDPAKGIASSTVTAVPEPATTTFVLAGLACFAARRRR
jgi:hypothetical protein